MSTADATNTATSSQALKGTAKKMNAPKTSQISARRRARGFDSESPVQRVGRYILLSVLLVICAGPFVLQVSNALKGPYENVYAFPPKIIPEDPTFANFAEVSRNIPVLDYAMHSLFVAIAMVITNIIFATLAGYALAHMSFKGKAIVLSLILSTLLIPGEVTLTSQYLTIKSLGLANTLVGVFLPTAVTAINVLLMMTAARSIPGAILDAATIDGANTLQKLRYIVWPNVRGMATVVGLMSFIQAWDDFLWPLVVLSDPDKYTLTVGMQYLNSSFGANPRVIAAGTVIALIPILILFISTQKYFFRGVEEGGVKG